MIKTLLLDKRVYTRLGDVPRDVVVVAFGEFGAVRKTDAVNPMLRRPQRPSPILYIVKSLETYVSIVLLRGSISKSRQVTFFQMVSERETLVLNNVPRNVGR